MELTALNEVEISLVPPELLWNNDFCDQQHITEYLQQSHMHPLFENNLK